MVNRVKSYGGDDGDICALHGLDIEDKHNFLIPMLAVTGIDAVELENEGGSIDRLDITALTRPNSSRKIVGLESKLKIHGEASFITNRTCSLQFPKRAENVEWEQMTGAVIAYRFFSYSLRAKTSYGVYSIRETAVTL
jgi:hypothetical protein